MNKKDYDHYSQISSIQIPPRGGGYRPDPENKQTPQQKKTVGNKPTVAADGTNQKNLKDTRTPTASPTS